MTKNKQLTLIVLLAILFFGCKREEVDKYTRPPWLAGKLYTQIKTKPELSTFAKLVEKSGYDSIINVSGSYTVFAPSDEAFAKYFQENPHFKSVDDMSRTDAIKLVKYHLVQNPWTKEQLQSLDVKGWIDTLDMTNDEPKGYKRETLFLEGNRKVGVQWSKYKKQNSTIKRTNIVDTTQTSWTRRVYTDSRKFSPIFYKEYFDIYHLSANVDFGFYFGRQFEDAVNIYYTGGRIISDEIFAENGIVYVIDRVTEPLKNGVELLTDKSKGFSYSTYYNMVNLFSEFTYNEKATFAQPGAAQGMRVDSLFNVTYPQLVFDIINEKTKPPRGVYGISNATIRYHHGIVAPTDEALKQLESQYLAGGNNWGSLEAAPENIKRIVANSSLSINPVYPSDFQKGFLNGEMDLIQIDESSIVQKEYGSNCTFIGVNKPIVPRAFSSVTGPVYTRKVYAKVMMAIEKAGLLPALKRKGANYSFYVESDVETGIDSSFFYDSFLERFYTATMYPAVKAFLLSTEDLRILLLNHIGESQPKGNARIEFIKNLAGNYITVNNETHEVKGTAPSTFGYQGSRTVTVVPTVISNNSDNGTTYNINSWLNFSVNDMFGSIQNRYPKFHALIKKAGYTLDKVSKYSFMSDNKYYTVFVPSDSILNVTNTNAMTTKELQDFVLLHFIQGDMIFTDGNKPTGYYETCRMDESSSPYNPVYTKIKIQPGIDRITIASKDDSPLVVVNESPKANFLTGRSLSLKGEEHYPNCVNTGVIHEINKVLLIGEVNTGQ